VDEVLTSLYASLTYSERHQLASWPRPATELNLGHHLGPNAHLNERTGAVSVVEHGLGEGCVGVRSISAGSTLAGVSGTVSPLSVRLGSGDAAAILDRLDRSNERGRGA